MEVKDLRYFIAVYEARNFAHAAVTLHTVQSNVSAHIRKLEQSLGVELFERHRRGALPTDKGERLYGYAKKVIGLLEEASDTMRRKESARPRADKPTLTPIIS